MFKIKRQVIQDCIIFLHDYVSCFHRASSARSKSSIESNGLMGTAERSFLTPKHAQETEVDMPSLDEFDAEIDIYRVRTELTRSRETKIKSRPKKM